MMLRESIKKYWVFIVIVTVALGVGIFLLYKNRQESSERTTQNVVTINNLENVPVEDNQPEVLPQEEKPAEKVPAAPSVPTEDKVTVPDDTPKVAPDKPTSSGIVKKLVNFGFQTASGRTIDTVIIHSTYNALGGDPFSVDKIWDIYKSYDVSPHYLIDRQGTIYQMVEDKNIAYHAGVAKLPDGRTDVNGASLGIEIINSKTDKFTKEQYAALNKLLGILKDRYKIKYVLGHNQIAPGRKDDPWNFDWGLVK
ncbi:MAG: N-acetylmuramoyl-L-alanine amidase [Parcubacteria group bacterium]|jgi:hypothetical protein